MKVRCTACFQPDEVIVSTAAKSRGQALSHFLLLQRQGYMPSMCEGATGQYTVCVDTAPLAQVSAAGLGALGHQGRAEVRAIADPNGQGSNRTGWGELIFQTTG